MTTPAPGMIGLTHINGSVGRAIRVGQLLNGEGFSTWEHAFVYLPGGLIVEAEPGGARIVPFNYESVYWCENIYRLGMTFAPLNAINNVAESFKGVPYSFADYAALAAHRLHIPAPHLRAFIADSGHMICSQLCDEFYRDLGVKIFTDGRWCGDVTPASLYNRDIALR